jgi:hypothetical protein
MDRPSIHEIHAFHGISLILFRAWKTQSTEQNKIGLIE